MIVDENAGVGTLSMAMINLSSVTVETEPVLTQSSGGYVPMINDAIVQHHPPTRVEPPSPKSREDKRSGLILTVAATCFPWDALGICRWFSMFCMLVLPLSVKLAYAQESAFVPVTIILEGPENMTSASETASPELDIDPLDIDVYLGGSNSFRVRLNSGWTGQVSVSIEVTTAPSSSGDVGDITITTDRDDRSLLFLPGDREKIVRVDAKTDAELGDYTVKLDASNSEGTDTENVTVTVKDWMTGFNVPQTWDVNWGWTSDLEFTLVAVEGDFVVPTTLTLSIPNKPGYLWFGSSMLTFNEGDYSTSKRFRIDATFAAVVDAEHPFVVTLSREGYNNISKSGKIKILSSPCNPNLTIGRERLDFGTWIRPETGEGSVTINAETDGYRSTMTAAGGNSPTTAWLELATMNCGYCELHPSTGDIEGKISGETIDFSMLWGIWDVEDGIWVDFEGGRHEPSFQTITNPDVSPTVMEFYGEISGIDSDTSIDTYEGKIELRVLCR